MSKQEDQTGSKAPTKIEDLSTRRFQQMAKENHELKAYVADVMQRLRQNERLFSRMFELESQVLKATDPEDLCFTAQTRLADAAIHRRAL